MKAGHSIHATIDRKDGCLPAVAAGSEATSRPGARAEAERRELSIAFFGHDAHESTIIKRAQAFANNGARVTGFMFSRKRATSQRHVSCAVVSLGETVDRNYLQRIPKLLGAMITLLRNRQALRQSDVIYARNIDMLLLAAFARWLSGGKLPIVYEALDVQRIFVGDRPVSLFFRWAERALMARSGLLVVSSPEFVAKYFTPMQGYRGPVFLLENKICPHQLPEGTAMSAGPRPVGPPWVIGWFGTLRCRRSLDALARIAKRLGAKIEVHIRGIPSHEDLTEAEIEAACVAVREAGGAMTFFGPYASPQDLSDIYGQVHFAWGFDFLDAGSNSDWLLPNRVYEGGAFSAVCLARAGTATGRFIEEKNTGLSFDEPIEDSVAAFLEGLDASAYREMQARVAATHRSQFFDETDTADLIGRMQTLSQRPGRG